MGGVVSRRSCVQCGHELRPDSKFCTTCGNAVFEGGPSTGADAGAMADPGPTLIPGAPYPPEVTHVPGARHTPEVTPAPRAPSGPGRPRRAAPPGGGRRPFRWPIV